MITSSIKFHPARLTRFTFIAITASAVLAWFLYKYPTGFDTPAGLMTLLILLACTAALLWAIPNPIPADFNRFTTQTGRLILLVLAVSLPLFILPTLNKLGTLLAMPALAAGVLIWNQAALTRRELIYALILAFTAAVAGLASGNITFISRPAWSALQLLLVSLGLLAGWKIFKSSGLTEYHIAYSRFLSEGWRSALRGFGLGMLIAVPWALGNIVLGGSHDPWVDAWWKPLVAIQPGIAEEAWGRVLMVALLYLVFRLATRPRIAFAIAFILAGYWFAYLHSPMGLNGLANTLLLGTLYALPITCLTLYRDLETGIGAHFCIDFIRFAFALLF